MPVMAIYSVFVTVELLNTLLIFIILTIAHVHTFCYIMSIEVQHRYMLVPVLQISAPAHVKEGAKMIASMASSKAL